MEHIEEFLKLHTPQRNDYLNFINPGKPSGFECTFEEGLCEKWIIVPEHESKDSRTNITEYVRQWKVLQVMGILLFL